MLRLFVLTFLIFSLGACNPSAEPSKDSIIDVSGEGWSNMLDPDLSQWDNYLSYRHKVGYKGEKPAEDPIGLNQPEGDDIFRTKMEGDDVVLHVTGEIYGSLVTKKTYRNYHFTLKVRWGDLKWDPRKDRMKDSGILYHSVGPHGAEYWRSWMLSQEMQIMEAHMGDYWSQATSAMDIRMYKPESRINALASLDKPFVSSGFEQEVRGYVQRRENLESPHGEWTTLELICFEGQSLHIVNGEVVMVLKNSRYKKDGEFIPLDEGKIQLQSEAGEVFFKDIAIRPLETLPEQYASLFE